jgi:hypothetical protein
MDLTENAPGRHSVPTNQDWDLLLVMKVPISSRVSCAMMPVLKRITCLEFCCGCACMLQGAHTGNTHMVDTAYDAPDDLVAHNACEVLHSYKQKHICQQSQNECTDCIIASPITTLLQKA